jgi:hypothetical protein
VKAERVDEFGNVLPPKPRKPYTKRVKTDSGAPLPASNTSVVASAAAASAAAQAALRNNTPLTLHAADGDIHSQSQSSHAAAMAASTVHATPVAAMAAFSGVAPMAATPAQQAYLTTPQYYPATTHEAHALQMAHYQHAYMQQQQQQQQQYQQMLLQHQHQQRLQQQQQQHQGWQHMNMYAQQQPYSAQQPAQQPAQPLGFYASQAAMQSQAAMHHAAHYDSATATAHPPQSMTPADVLAAARAAANV